LQYWGSLKEERGLIEELQKELGMLANEGLVEPAILEYQRALVLIMRRLMQPGLTQEHLIGLLNDTSGHHAIFLREADKAKAIIAEHQETFEASTTKSQILDRIRSGGNRVEVLQQLMTAARQRVNPVLNKRISDRYVKIMQRNIETRLSHVTGYRSTITQVEERIKAVRDRLWAEYQISLPLHVLKGWSTDGARATGEFDGGVFICSWPHLLELGRSSDAGVMTTLGTGSAVVTYRRTPHGGIERC